MPIVPTPHEFVPAVLTDSEMNVYVADPLNFLLRRPIAHLWQTVVQSIPNSVVTPVLFDTEMVDSANGHSTSVNTSRYTAVYPGWYRISGGIAFAPNATGGYEVGWLVNGVSLNGSALAINAALNIAGPAARTSLVYLAEGDYVELYGYQTSGGALNTVSATTHQPSMTVVWESI